MSRGERRSREHKDPYADDPPIRPPPFPPRDAPPSPRRLHHLPPIATDPHPRLASPPTPSLLFGPASGPGPSSHPPDPLTRGPPQPPLARRPSRPTPPGPPPTYTSFRPSTFHEPAGIQRRQSESDRRGSLHRTATIPGSSSHTSPLEYPPLSSSTDRPTRHSRDPLISPRHPSGSIPASSSDTPYIARRNEPTGTASKGSPPLSPGYPPRDTRTLSHPNIYELRHPSSASTTAPSSSRSQPAYTTMTMPPLHTMADVYPQDMPLPFDYPRDVKRPRYESPPPDPSAPARPRLSPNHPTPTSITALLSTEHSGPQEPPSTFRPSAAGPTASSGRSAPQFPPLSPVLRTSPYHTSVPPPASALLQPEAQIYPPRERFDVRRGSAGDERPFHRDFNPSASITRPRSPLRSHPMFEPDREREHRVAGQASYEPRRRDLPRMPSRPTTHAWVSLGSSPARRNFASWPEDRLEAYRAGYDDAMWAVQAGAVEVGGTSYPHPSISRRGSHDVPTAGPSHFPSPAFTEPSRLRRRSPDYPIRPPAPPRVSTYPTHRYERPREAYAGQGQQTWATDPPSPRRRGTYEPGPYERERDRHGHRERERERERERHAAHRRSSAAYHSHAETVYQLAGPSRPTRQLISCYPCRTRKLKCDGQRPCGQCVRRDGEADCKYAEKVRRRGKGKRLPQSGSSQNSEDREEAPSDGEAKTEDTPGGGSGDPPTGDPSSRSAEMEVELEVETGEEAEGSGGNGGMMAPDETPASPRVETGVADSPREQEPQGPPQVAPESA